MNVGRRELMTVLVSSGLALTALSAQGHDDEPRAKGDGRGRGGRGAAAPKGTVAVAATQAKSFASSCR